MLALAELAVEQAATEPRDVQALTMTHLGNAYRVNGRFAEAHDSFNKAEALYSRPEPILLRFRASLLQDQRKFGAAIACLKRAARLEKDRENQANIKLHLANVLDLAGEHHAAANLVGKALDDLKDPKIVAAAFHGLAHYLVNAGQTERALFVLQHGDRFFDFFGSLAQLRVVWLKGRLAAAVGDQATALDSFRKAKEGFAAKSMLQEVALLSLETAYEYARRHDLAAAQAELEGLPEILQALGIAPEAAAAKLLQLALRARTAPRLVKHLLRLVDLLSIRRPRPTRA
ncbi:MAG TPA: hypothetical protein VFR31_16235 [Thermoanaerobaculia bacterium]|nr:hypothetical protein [Thermoanaerobaculia bacterium]